MLFNSFGRREGEQQARTESDLLAYQAHSRDTLLAADVQQQQQQQEQEQRDQQQQQHSRSDLTSPNGVNGHLTDGTQTPAAMPLASGGALLDTGSTFTSSTGEGGGVNVNGDRGHAGAYTHTGAETSGASRILHPPTSSHTTTAHSSPETNPALTTVSYEVPPTHSGSERSDWHDQMIGNSSGSGSGSRGSGGSCQGKEGAVAGGATGGAPGASQGSSSVQRSSSSASLSQQPQQAQQAQQAGEEQQQALWGGSRELSHATQQHAACVRDRRPTVTSVNGSETWCDDEGQLLQMPNIVAHQLHTPQGHHPGVGNSAGGGGGGGGGDGGAAAAAGGGAGSRAASSSGSGAGSVIIVSGACGSGDLFSSSLRGAPAPPAVTVTMEDENSAEGGGAGGAGDESDAQSHEQQQDQQQQLQQQRNSLSSPNCYPEGATTSASMLSPWLPSSLSNFLPSWASGAAASPFRRYVYVHVCTRVHVCT